MQKIKFKSFVLIIPILIFSGISFYIINLIITTLKFESSKNESLSTRKYSYVIVSSKNKVLSKLSRKFDVNNSDDVIPFLIKSSFITAEDKRFGFNLLHLKQLKNYVLSLKL